MSTADEVQVSDPQTGLADSHRHGVSERTRQVQVIVPSRWLFAGPALHLAVELLSFCAPRQSLLLGKQRNAWAASPPFPDLRNRHPRPGPPDRACCSPRRESALPGPLAPACA